MTKNEIEFQCQLAYDEKFLELIGKKVGDKVMCNFSYHYGTSKSSYSSMEESVGTIIRDEFGYAVISDKNYSSSKSVRNKPYSPTDFSTHWVYENKPCRMKLNFIVVK